MVHGLETLAVRPPIDDGRDGDVIASMINMLLNEFYATAVG